MIRQRSIAALAMSLVTLLVALPAGAQTQTGSVTFELRDTAGAPLPGVTILLDSERLQGTQVRDTDARGRAHFPLLPPGEYTAEISLGGYLTLQNHVSVGLGMDKLERVVMAKGEMTEEITVIGNKPIDTTETGTTHVYSAEVIQNIQLGSGNRTYQDVLQSAPGVGGGGNPAVRGATLGENRYTIDGVDTSDPVTGTFGLNTNFDSTEQVEFATGGLDASMGLATGGLVNLITKSGGNTHDGVVDIRYFDEKLIENSPHFSPEAPQEFKRLDFSFGGPVIKDKLWYYAAYSKSKRIEGISGGAAPRIFDGQFYLAKFTWQLDPDNRMAFQYMSDPADISNTNAGPETALESHAFQTQGADFFKINYWGRLSDHWSLEILAGDYESKLDAFPLRDSGLPALINDADGHISRNYNDAQYSTRRRRQYAWNAEYTTPNERFHSIQFGMDFMKPEFSFERRQPGGYEEHFNTSRPSGTTVRYRNVLVPAGRSTNEGKIVGFFLQDKWHVNSRVTLRFGMRYDKAEFDRDDKTTVFHVSKWQPRFGAAFDPKGDGKTKVDFSLTRSLHPAILTIVNVLNTRGDFTEQQRNEAVYGVDYNGDGDITDGEFVTTAVFGGPSGSTIQEGIKPTYEDEFEAGYTYALRDNMILGARVSFSHTYDLIEDTEFPVGTGGYQIRNIDELQRRYKGLELSYKWHADRWHVLGNWTIAEAKGNVEYTQHLGSDYDILPYHSVNRFGWLHTDARHRVKINGWVELPKEWKVGYELNWMSGLAYSHTQPSDEAGYGDEFLEPRGSRRLPSLRTMSTDVQKKFDFGPAALSLIGTITNLLNDNAVTRRNATTDADEIYQRPRAYELGLRFEF